MRRRKMYFLVYQKKKGQFGDPASLIFITKHLVKCVLFIYWSGNMKEFIWKKSGNVKNLYRNVKDF